MLKEEHSTAAAVAQSAGSDALPLGHQCHQSRESVGSSNGPPAVVAATTVEPDTSRSRIGGADPGAGTKRRDCQDATPTPDGTPVSLTFTCNKCGKFATFIEKELSRHIDTTCRKTRRSSKRSNMSTLGNAWRQSPTSGTTNPCETSTESLDDNANETLGPMATGTEVGHPGSPTTGPHRCDECPQTFQILGQLAHHRDEDHSGTVWCPKCFQSVLSKRLLGFHLATHVSTDEAQNADPLQCIICHGRFETEGRVRAHRRRLLRIQGTSTVYYCHVRDCRGRYSHERDLMSHINKDHPDRHQCEFKK